MASVIDITDEDDDETQADHRHADSELKALEEELAQVEEHIEVLLQRQQELQARRQQLRQIAQTNRRAPRADWCGAFPWDTKALTLLKEVFKLPAFRPQQREVINATMQGRDVLCLIPSGGGKSLCYQLPALLGGGCTLVISPLLSLIQDQVFSLLESNIRVASLTSLTPKEELSAIYKQIESDEELRLLYVTPERVMSAKRFMGKLEKMYKAGRLKRIAVDECHCCSQWGNDFRPDYKKLGVLKQQFPDVPILALTATATQRVRSDLEIILRIPGCEIFHTNVDRPNLFYQVRWKPAALGVVKDMVHWISEHYPGGEIGIVYCLTRKDAETVAGHLNDARLPAGVYHADIDPATRQLVHHQWSKGQLRVIVATIAFGMGINKVDVRFVIHHSISKSIENYYQESGRAGRDGLPARCLLYYRPADLMRQAAIVVTEPGWEAHLFNMVRYAANISTCRRAIISRHFAEAPAGCSQQCDVCASAQGTQRQDIMAEARAVMSVLAGVPAQDKRQTLTQLIDRWRTCKDLATQQLAKAGTRDDNERIIAQLLLHGILQMDFGFTAYQTTAYVKQSAQGMLGRKAVFMDVPKMENVPDQQLPKKRKT